MYYISICYISISYIFNFKQEIYLEELRQKNKNSWQIKNKISDLINIKNPQNYSISTFFKGSNDRL